MNRECTRSAGAVRQAGFQNAVGLENRHESAATQEIALEGPRG
jgi:hypothetical protein